VITKRLVIVGATDMVGGYALRPSLRARASRRGGCDGPPRGDDQDSLGHQLAGGPNTAPASPPRLFVDALGREQPGCDPPRLPPCNLLSEPWRQRLSRVRELDADCRDETLHC
jgi:hypothetical protein